MRVADALRKAVVRVRDYVRKDGTAVQAHTRGHAAPDPEEVEDPWHTPAQVAVFDDVLARFRGAITVHALQSFDEADLDEAMADPPQRNDIVAEWMDDEHGLDVREDGRFECSWKAPTDRKIARVIGAHPVVMYHHTSSALLPEIAQRGLVASSKRTDPRSTARHHAVYLTIETSGPAVAGYLLRTTRTHGGDPVTLEVETFVRELDPDPDDADISAGHRQAVTDSVPPDRILNLGEFEKAMAPDRAAIADRMVGVGSAIHLYDHEHDDLLAHPSLWLDAWGRGMVASAARLPPDDARAFVMDPDSFVSDPRRAALVEFELDGAWASLVEEWM